MLTEKYVSIIISLEKFKEINKNETLKGFTKFIKKIAYIYRSKK